MQNVISCAKHTGHKSNAPSVTIVTFTDKRAFQTYPHLITEKPNKSELLLDIISFFKVFQMLVVNRLRSSAPCITSR